MMNGLALQKQSLGACSATFILHEMSLGMMLTATLQESGERSFVLFNFAVSNHTHPELLMSCADTTA